MKRKDTICSKKMNNRRVLKLNNFRRKYYLSSNSSSEIKISTAGSLRIFLFEMRFSNESRSEGNSSKLEDIANKSVIETKPPKAMVPPKLETVNTKNPKNKTIEV